MFFHILVLHIPHFLRDLLWMVRAWYSVAPILFSLIISWASSSSESNHFFLAHIPRTNESHDPGMSFKVAITTYAFSTCSSTATSCSLIWETRVKYDCMVSAFWIFTFFNWFLKIIFRFMFFPSNSLVKESNISFDVFREDTCGTSWSVTESAMIFLVLSKFFLCNSFSLISLWNWNLSTCVGVQFIFFREII